MLRRGSKLLMNILRTFNISEEVIRRCSIIKGVLRNFAKFTGKHLYRRLFFNKVAGLRAASLLKKETLAQVFFCEFCEISKSTFYYKHLRMTVSDMRSVSKGYLSVNTSVLKRKSGFRGVFRTLSNI